MLNFNTNTKKYYKITRNNYVTYRVCKEINKIDNKIDFDNESVMSKSASEFVISEKKLDEKYYDKLSNITFGLLGINNTLAIHGTHIAPPFFLSFIIFS